MKSYSKKASCAESQERINDSDSGKSLEPRTIEIQRDVSFMVQSETVEGGFADSVVAQRRWDKQTITTVVNAVN